MIWTLSIGRHSGQKNRPQAAPYGPRRGGPAQLTLGGRRRVRANGAGGEPRSWLSFGPAHRPRLRRRHGDLIVPRRTEQVGLRAPERWAGSRRIELLDIAAHGDVDDVMAFADGHRWQLPGELEIVVAFLDGPPKGHGGMLGITGHVCLRHAEREGVHLE